MGAVTVYISLLMIAASSFLFVKYNLLNDLLHPPSQHGGKLLIAYLLMFVGVILPVLLL